MAGGKKRGRTQRRHFRQNRENVWKYNNKKGRPDGADDGSNPDPNPNPNPNSNPSWQPFATQNPAFEEYYKEQCIVTMEEWDTFINILRNPLPAAFRINSSGQFFEDIRTQLEEDFMKSLKADVTSENEVDAIRPLPWYPGKLAWHLNFSRMQLRKNQTLERFHEFLKQENEIGNITRQEAVSMVPPLFLDVSPEHYVLDMCAAPGSKTFQLLELMHNSAEIGSLPSGMVIANDVDVQRCNLLIHQTKRMCSANLMVTNHEAQHFPNCRLNNGRPETGNETDVSSDLTNDTTLLNGQEQLEHKEILFDRILCDVPCSGDGTLRKAPDIWRKWHSGMGNGLHNLQVLITMRGLTLLKVGGRMVYSTCSMNPVENEAVISEVLSKCGESVELLDVSTEIPELVRRPGLKKWKVRDKGLWLSSSRDVPSHRKSTILPSMFPAGRTAAVSSADIQDQDNKVAQGNNSRDENLKNDLTFVDKESTNQIAEDPNFCLNSINSDCKEESNFPLERCMRIVPHDQNSGAFFIAVLRKLSPVQIAEKGVSHSWYTINRRKQIQEDESDITDGKPGEEKRVSENDPDQCSSAANSSDASIRDEQFDVKMNDSVGMGSNGTISSSNGMVNTKLVDVGENHQEREKDGKGKLQIQGKWRGIDPVVFFEDVTTIESIRAFYGIQQSFELDGHLVSRNEDSNRVKRIYYISKSVRDVLKLNFKVGQRLKIASLGLKLFERQASKDGSIPCAFRISSEGLPLILPYISKQILHASLGDFQHLLQYRNIKFAEFVDADFSNKASKLLSGCCVVVLNKGYQPSGATLVDEQTIAIVCWKGRNSLSVLVSEIDGNELLQRLLVRFGIRKSVVQERADPIPQSLDDEFDEDVKEHKQEAAVEVEELGTPIQQ